MRSSIVRTSAYAILSIEACYTEVPRWLFAYSFVHRRFFRNSRNSENNMKWEHISLCWTCCRAPIYESSSVSLRTSSFTSLPSSSTYQPFFYSLLSSSRTLLDYSLSPQQTLGDIHNFNVCRRRVHPWHVPVKAPGLGSQPPYPRPGLPEWSDVCPGVLDYIDTRL